MGVSEVTPVRASTPLERETLAADAVLRLAVLVTGVPAAELLVALAPLVLLLALLFSLLLVFDTLMLLVMLLVLVLWLLLALLLLFWLLLLLIVGAGGVGLLTITVTGQLPP